MPSKAATLPSEPMLVEFESYTQALVLHTAVFLLRHAALTMRRLHVDPQAIAYLEQEAQAAAQLGGDEDLSFLPSVVPALLEAYSHALVMHTAAFLLRHYAITLHGRHLDPRAVAYLEQEAQALEQHMDDQDTAFPGLLDTAVLGVMHALVVTEGHQECQDGSQFSSPIPAATRR